MSLVSQQRSAVSPASVIRGFRPRTRVGLLAAVLTCVGAPLAIAHWSVAGAGSGSATAGSMQPATVETAGFGSHLYPGGPATNVTLHVINPNPYAVNINTVTAGAIHSDLPGCDGSATGVTLDVSTLAGSLPAGTSTFVASAVMDNTSVSACQGARFTSLLTLAVRR